MQHREDDDVLFANDEENAIRKPFHDSSTDGVQYDREGQGSVLHAIKALLDLIEKHVSEAITSLVIPSHGFGDIVFGVLA